jgi:signal peptidase II
LKRDYSLFIGAALTVLLVDQFSKWLVVNHLDVHQIRTIIPGFFNLVLVKNRGMAFGIFSQTRSGFPYYFLLATTIGAVVVIVSFFCWTKRNRRWLTVGLSVILGGAVGNLIDRVRFGYVIDFLDFLLKAYHWPAFNVADSAVTVGTFWLFFNIMKGKSLKEEKP